MHNALARIALMCYIPRMGKVEDMRAQRERRAAEAERLAAKVAQPANARQKPTREQTEEKPKDPVEITVSPLAYRDLRRLVGGRVYVAQLLGVHKLTLAAREQGRMKITQEAWLALTALSQNKKPTPPAI